jgi:hypothetical protein
LFCFSGEMANAIDMPRAQRILGLSLPLAVLLGYFLAEPMELGSLAVVVFVLVVLSIPLMMKWYYPFLVLAWNAGICPTFFPGRPFTGERAAIPGIEYPSEEKCFWTRHLRGIWKQYQANPDGPHSYGWWDSCPVRPEARPTHARWLRQYLPLVEEGTWAWLEITHSDLFTQPPTQEVVASAFANREFYVVLANYGRSAVEVMTRDAYLPVGDTGAAPTRKWNVAGRSLQILRRQPA